MANIKSAKKRILQSNKRKVLNKSVRTEVKTETKKFLHTLGSTSDEAKHTSQLQYVEKIVDKAASKGVIHKNKAARIKSRLHKKMNDQYVSHTEPNAVANIASSAEPDAGPDAEISPANV